MFLPYNEMEYLKGMASLSEKNPTTRQRITAIAHEKLYVNSNHLVANLPKKSILTQLLVIIL